MKYNGFYYWLFSNQTKKVLTERYGSGYARDIMKRSKPVYRERGNNLWHPFLNSGDFTRKTALRFIKI